MSAIDLFNSSVSDYINKSETLYESWFGKTSFVPETTIIESKDFNCGAVCNELEFARVVTQYYVKSLDIDFAEHNELEALINGFINLPRRGRVESDLTFRNRFKFLVVDNLNKRRVTKWSILDAIKYFIAGTDDSVQLIEQFDSKNLYFQIRVEGVVDVSAALTFDSTVYGFLDQFFLSGPSLGEVNTYLTELLKRIKAAGIDFDVIFIEQDRVNKLSNAFIGTIQVYKQSAARIKNKASIAKASNAIIA